MKLKLNHNYKIEGKTYAKGSVVDLDKETSEVKKKFWRRRLKDSSIDNCVELLTQTKTKKK